MLALRVVVVSPSAMGWDSSVHHQAVHQKDAREMSLIFLTNKALQTAPVPALDVTLMESGMQSQLDNLRIMPALGPHAWGWPLETLTRSVTSTEAAIHPSAVRNPVGSRGSTPGHAPLSWGLKKEIGVLCTKETNHQNSCGSPSGVRGQKRDRELLLSLSQSVLTHETGKCRLTRRRSFSVRREVAPGRGTSRCRYPPAREPSSGPPSRLTSR